MTAVLERNTTTSRPTNDRFLRTAGWSGIAATLAYAVTIVVNNIAPISSPEGPAEMADYLDEVAATAWSPITYGVFGIVMALVYIPMAVGVHRTLGRSTRSWFGTAAVVSGVSLLVPAYVIALIPAASLTSVAETVSAEALWPLYAMLADTALLLFVIGSFLSLAIGPFLWGLERLRVVGRTCWIGWTGVVTGITGLVWVGLIVGTAPIALLLGHVLGGVVMFTALSVALIRS